MKRILTLLFLLPACFTQAQNQNMVLRDQLTYPGQTLANIWGYVDSLGNEYALVGASQGLSIVNVTDPSNIFQVAQIPGPDNLWKEVKTWNGVAYVTTEAQGVPGLQLIDLRNLPSTNIPSKYWGPAVGNTTLKTIHALHIDNGYAYLYGANGSGSSIQGVVIANLSDPWNPTVAGYYGQEYIHDGYVRNDTLWAGNIYAGHFSVINVANKANPQVVATHNTPGNFTHNTWLSDDGRTLFTTDEVSNSYLTSYDITDLNNITELDRFQTTPGSNSVVHNTHILNDYAVTSWYRDGVVIVDAHRPQNLVQVARYDNYAGSGNGMDGNWGVYPYLPSGNLVVSNIDEGLFVFTPTYVRAAYLEGTVTDSICNTIIDRVKVTISSVNVIDSTSNAGEYKMGTAMPGTYNVTFSKPGYQSKTITGVVLTAGQVTNLNVKLYSSSTVAVNGSTKSAGSALGQVKVTLQNTSNTYTFTSNSSGAFSGCNILAGTYEVLASKWGYKSYCGTVTFSSASSLNIDLTQGYYDDFINDLGWTVTGNATTGTWERGIPKLTLYNNATANPGTDSNADCGTRAYVTGNSGTTSSDDDVDNGSTILTSPVFDLSSVSDPFVNYERFFFNSGGSGAPNDSLKIMLTNGTVTVTLETVTDTSAGESTWKRRAFRIADYITPGANMRLIVRTADATPGHLVEAGFDAFEITSGSPSALFNPKGENNYAVYPNPFTEGFNIRYGLDSESALAAIYDSKGSLVKEVTLTGKSGTRTIDGDFPAGLYFVKITTEKGSVSTLKVISK